MKHSYCDIHRNRPISIIHGNKNYTIKLLSRGSKYTSDIANLCPQKKYFQVIQILSTLDHSNKCLLCIKPLTKSH